MASVRQMYADSFERVSTVELRPFRDGGAHDGARIGVVQHYGERNGVPSAAAQAAVSEFQDAVEAGLHPLHDDALERRTGEGFLDAYDWRTPGAMDQAHAAWAEYLPRDLAAGGTDALRARVLEEARAIAACGGSVDMPEALPAPEPDDGGLRPGI